MAHTEHHGGHHVSSEAAGHETSDASLGGVERFMIITALLLAAAFGLVWLMYTTMASREAALDVKPSPASGRQGDRLPPLPRLQTLPYDEMDAYRRGEAASVDTWVWVDKAGGVAQIPVARAIDILAERGLPVPPPQAAPAPAAIPPPPAGGATPAPGTASEASPRP